MTLALSQMVDVMKVQVSNTLVESSKELNLDQKSLQKLNFIITEVITNHQKEILVAMVVQIMLTIQLMVAVAVLELQVKKLTLTELVMVVLV
ncbi:MAG: hypothetical protein EBY54_03790 [Proteobacteria bacterium]|nr:hypothetical protein [Pseudomonadota bacterium]